MRVIVILIGLVVVQCLATAVCNEERIMSCLMNYMDNNTDSQIDHDEINAYIINPCPGGKRIRTCAETVLQFCDANQNGVIDAGDYDMTDGPARCFRRPPIQREICKECDRCDAGG